MFFVDKLSNATKPSLPSEIAKDSEDKTPVFSPKHRALKHSNPTITKKHVLIFIHSIKI